MRSDKTPLADPVQWWCIEAEIPCYGKVILEILRTTAVPATQFALQRLSQSGIRLGGDADTIETSHASHECA